VDFDEVLMPLKDSSANRERNPSGHKLTKDPNKMSMIELNSKRFTEDGFKPIKPLQNNHPKKFEPLSL
jgi:hypothetical protein